MKDDSSASAVFTEQRSSASQITAANVMDVVARRTVFAAQAADAISVYTQVNMEDASALLKLIESKFPDIYIRFPRHTWPTSWSNMEDPVVLFARNLCGHPLFGLLWKSI